MNSKELYPFSNALQSLPEEAFWGVCEEIEKRPLIIEDMELRKQCEELDKEINQLMQDASAAKITAEDDN